MLVSDGMPGVGRGPRISNVNQATQVSLVPISVLKVPRNLGLTLQIGAAGNDIRRMSKLRAEPGSDRRVIQKARLRFIIELQAPSQHHHV